MGARLDQGPVLCDITTLRPMVLPRWFGIPILVLETEHYQRSARRTLPIVILTPAEVTGP